MFRANLWHRQIAAVLVCCFLADLAVAGTAGYRFERFWPVLQQPWYFGAVLDMRVMPDGSIYAITGVTDQARLIHLNADGGFVRSIELGQVPDIASFASTAALAVNDTYAFIASRNFMFRFRLDDGSLDLQWSVEPMGNPGDCFANGLDFMPGGDLAVSCQESQQVYIFSQAGTLLTNWPADMLGCPAGCLTLRGQMAVAPTGEILIISEMLDAVNVYDSSGNFLSVFLSSGAQEPLIEQSATSIAVNSNGQVAITDGRNSDTATAKLYQADGTFIRSFLTKPPNQAELALPRVDWHNEDVVWVSDAGSDNQITRYSGTGTIFNTFSSSGTDSGKFRNIYSVAHHPNGSLYAIDRINHRVQQFSTDGLFIREWGGFDPQGMGGFSLPFDLTVGPNGDVFVIDNLRAQRFDQNGNFLTQWDVTDLPVNIVATANGDLYITRFSAGTVDRYVPPLDGLSTSPHTLDKSVSYSGAWAMDEGSDGNLYVSDSSFNKIYVIEPVTLNPLGQWGTFGFDENDIRFVQSVTATPDGRILIASSDTKAPNPLQVFDLTGNFLDAYRLRGIAPGSFSLILGRVGQAPDGTLFVPDFTNNRIQKLVPVSASSNSLSIVVAAGGPFPGNVLWPATQLNANFAFRSLIFQGFSKETIQYLSSDLGLDLDQNGLADDVDLDATNANLMQSILGPGGLGLDGFAGDPSVEELVIYLVDHGGQDQFRMSGTETLDASLLEGWLSSWQAAHPGATVRVVYDACQSGSFLSTLAGTDRTIITSAMGDENAYFVSQGTLSFSNFFWTHIFNGLDLKNSFELAAQSTTDAFELQHPQIDADGDGVPNEPMDDLMPLENVFIGNGTDTFSSRPVIGSVTGGQTLSSGNSATVSAFNVTDGEGIARVWAVLRPPGFNPGSPDNPVSDLPSFNLLPIGGDTYELTYDGFSSIGTYQITVNALDEIGNSAVPKVTSVTVENPLKRRSVVIVGGQNTDANYPIFETNGTLAVAALQQQGYGPDGTDCTNALCDDIKFYVDTGLADTDGTAVLSNIQFAIEQWGADEDGDLMADVQDLTIYLVGEPELGGFRLSNNEILTPALLDASLQIAEGLVPGIVTLVVDGDEAGDFVSQLTPGASRITVASAGPKEVAQFFDGGQISFSQFFWGLTLNGATVNQSFSVARQAVNFGPDSQSSELDDTGNGIPNELFDGLVASRYSIGNGVLLAGDSPVIGGISLPAIIMGDSFDLTVSEVTSTGTIASVIAIVFEPDGSTQEVPLAEQGGGDYQATITVLNLIGTDVEIVAFAEDADGNVSLPAITRAIGDVIFLTSFE